jgi:histidyl-tRNA synthetase
LRKETLPGPTVFCLIEDEALRQASLRVVQQLRDANLSCEFALTQAKSDKQFKRAQELGVRFTIRLEGDTGNLKVRDLKNRSDSRLPVEAAIESIQQATE